jgi:hypothetical protein
MKKQAVSEIPEIIEWPARKFKPLKTNELSTSARSYSRNHKNAGVTLNVHENKKDIESRWLKFTSKTLSFHEKSAPLAANLECL